MSSPVSDTPNSFIDLIVRENKDFFNYEIEFRKLREICVSENPSQSEGIVLREEGLRYLNRNCYDNGNTFLIKCVELGKLEAVGYCLKFDGLKINVRNRDKKTAADVAWEKKDHVCLLYLLQADSLFPSCIKLDDIDGNALEGKELRDFMKERTELHDLIRKGDLESIKQMLQTEKPSFYYNPRNRTATYSALTEKQFEIYAYLLFVGALYSERDKITLRSDEQERLNCCLEEYFIRGENFHAMKLEISSRILGEVSESRKNTIKRLFDGLNKIEFIRLIMKVLELQDISVVFDFNSKAVDRVYSAKYSKVFGLAIPARRRIYIGSKNCDSEEAVYRKVAGTLAHELCHLCMKALYENDAKPYKLNDKGRMKDFSMISDIVEKSVKGSSGVIHEVVEVVFSECGEERKHAELIVRVPHTLGILGEDEGTTELYNHVPDLLEYYSTNVYPDCKKYAEKAHFASPLLSIEHLHSYRGIVQGEDKNTSPFHQSIRSFEESIQKFRNMNMIFTSYTEFCILHVYHELKRKFEFHFEKCCLFFDVEFYRTHEKCMKNAYNCKEFRYLVLVAKEGNPGYMNISSVLGTIPSNEEKGIILILGENCQDPEIGWKRNVLHYDWNDFNDSFKQSLLKKKVNFQGQHMELKKLIDTTPVQDIITPQVLKYLWSNEEIRIGDDTDLRSLGYDEKLYIERTLVRYNMNEMVKNVETGAYYLYVTGLPQDELTQNGIDEKIVQMIDEEDTIHDETLIALPKSQEKAKKIYENVFQNDRKWRSGGKDTAHWVHLYEGNYYWRTSNQDAVDGDELCSEELTAEKELLRKSHARNDRIIVISDDPGTGKSTILTDLIIKTKEEWPAIFLFRVDFNKYADSVENPLSLANVKDGDHSKEVIAYFLDVLRIQNPFERNLGNSFLHKPQKIKVFFDGLDEISPSYEQNALTLLKTLKRETSIQIWVTTRKHLRVDLEIALNAVSYSMKQLSPNELTDYMSKFWKEEIKTDLGRTEENRKGAIENRKGAIEHLKNKIVAIAAEVECAFEKHENSKLVQSMKALSESIGKYDGDHERTFVEEIDKLKRGMKELDFKSYAKVLLDDLISKIADETFAFTSIPLHIYMLAKMSYQDNLKIQTNSTLYILYSNFVEKKIDIYMKDKCRIKQETQGSINLNRTLRATILVNHGKIAECVINPNDFPWDFLKDEEDMRYISDIGLVTQSGDLFKFVHRTFAEFFYCDRILEMIRSGRLDKKTLHAVCLEKDYSVVLKFLDCAFMKDEVKCTLKKEQIIKWDWEKLIIKMIDKKTGDINGKEFIRAILAIFDKECNHSLNQGSFNIIRKVFHPSVGGFINQMCNLRKGYPMIKMLCYCLSDAISFELFDARIKQIRNAVHRFVEDAPASDVSEMLEMLRRVHRYKASLHSITNTSGAHSMASEGNRNGSESDSVVRVKVVKLRIFEREVKDRCNIFHCAAKNKDEMVFLLVLRLAEEILRREEIGEYLLERDKFGNTVLRGIVKWSKPKNGGENILLILRKIRDIVDKDTFVKLLRDKGDDQQSNVLQETALSIYTKHSITCWIEYFHKLLQLIVENGGRTLVRELLLEMDRNVWKILRCAARERDIGIFASVLREMRKHLSDDGEIEEFVMRGYKYGDTVFHDRASREFPIRDLILLESYIGKRNFCKLLKAKNMMGQTCLHFTFVYGWYRKTAEIILDNLNFVSESLDADSLRDFLLATDSVGNTILHYAVENEISLIKLFTILSALKIMLNETDFQILLGTRNNRDEVVISEESSDCVEMKIIKYKDLL